MGVDIVVMMVQWVFCAALMPGDLGPGHLALVFNRNSQASGELALHYAKVRGIPTNRLLGLDLPLVETLPRDQYEPEVAGPIRQWLTSRRLCEKVACLVSFYDVPIRVSGLVVTPEMRQHSSRIEARRLAVIQEIRRVIRDVDGIAEPSPTSAPSTTGTTTRSTERIDVMAKDYRASVDRALRRASFIRDPQDAVIARRQLMAFMERAEGVSGILPRLRPTGPPNDPLGQVQLDKLRVAVREAQSKINSLLKSKPLAPERDEARQLIERYGGLFGLLSHLDEEVQRLQGTETSASLDSELSTLWSQPAGLYRWKINTLNVREGANTALRAALGEAEWASPIMMVGRLDGPSPRVVRRMIDDALDAEKTGLKGHAYFDARGLPKGNQPGSYELYDENIRSLAALVLNKTNLRAVLDNRPEIFDIGACPDTAIYCGWYRVGRYQDSFRFVRGAVALHIASNEAISLRDPQQKYWCKELLDHGAAATMGPVDEPYLMAFPSPRDFFGLLLTGRFSLVECYYLTNPYNSWKMLLLGDPLYRPFAAAPQLKLTDVFPPELPLSPIPLSQPAE